MLTTEVEEEDMDRYGLVEEMEKGSSRMLSETMHTCINPSPPPTTTLTLRLLLLQLSTTYRSSPLGTHISRAIPTTARIMATDSDHSMFQTSQQYLFCGDYFSARR